MILWLIAAALMAPAPTSERPSMSCLQGPVQRHFGGGEWLVYGCDDRSTVIVVSAKGNPAFEFYFILGRKADGTPDIYGEGNGSKAASDAAGNELSKLSVEDVKALWRATLKPAP